MSPSSCPQIFNRSHIQQHRNRATKKFSHHRFIFDWCERQILERLLDIRRDFKTCLLTSDRFSDSFIASLNADTVAIQTVDCETLSIADASQDLAISILDLHTVNDLPGLLIQIRRTLKPDGLFLGCLFGGETLHELRSVLLEAELQTLGGASPRVAPLIDKPQMGGLLQRAGFSLPVVDSEILTVSYRDIFHLMADLRGMGEQNALYDRRKTFTPSSVFAAANALYAEKFPDDTGRVGASFEIIFVIGWAPHESQQTPLKRGSGQVSLKDVL